MIRHAFLAVLLGLAAFSPAAAESKLHRVAIQVSDGDPARMNLALNNAINIVKVYQARKEAVEVRIVTYGPGVTLVRSDSSPLATRVKSFVDGVPEVGFDVCDNTLTGLRKTEGREIPIFDGVTHVEAGAVTLMELQEQGWSYLRP
ncbi:MAG: hypothetical protein EPN20_15825 [Magnetospirillum sp.]|nr:MAG: hypothetical protein EPN20_15825 [Magnetospirillum sp.]